MTGGVLEGPLLWYAASFVFADRAKANKDDSASRLMFGGLSVGCFVMTVFSCIQHLSLLFGVNP